MVWRSNRDISFFVSWSYVWQAIRGLKFFAATSFVTEVVIFHFSSIILHFAPGSIISVTIFYGLTQSNYFRRMWGLLLMSKKNDMIKQLIWWVNFSVHNQFRYNMKKSSIQILLVTGISFFILFFPAYFRYSNLSEMTLFGTDLNFENPDQDDQIQDQQQGSDLFSLSVFYAVSLPEANPFEPFCHFYSPVLSLDQKTCVLRC